MFDTAQALFDSLFRLGSSPRKQDSLAREQPARSEALLRDRSSKHAPRRMSRRMSGGEAATVEPIHRSRSIAAFTPGGTILEANDPFLEAMGYSRDEIQGKHHRLFVEDEHARSEAYRAFWEKLRQGKYHSGQFKRVSRDGRAVWLQATYNPVFGPDGKVEKVTEIASDVTEQDEVEAERKTFEEENALRNVFPSLITPVANGPDGPCPDKVERLAETLQQIAEVLEACSKHRRIENGSATAGDVSAQASNLHLIAEELPDYLSDTRDSNMFL
jgi:PAS domain S-box-containing protein